MRKVAASSPWRKHRKILVGCHKENGEMLFSLKLVAIQTNYLLSRDRSDPYWYDISRLLTAETKQMTSFIR